MTAADRDRLGRGLAALIGDDAEGEPTAEGIQDVETDRIVPNPFQPRQEFTEDELRELADSIRENGLLQPLVVRPGGGGDGEGTRYQLVAGERRLRAVRLLEWEAVPAIVREVDDETLLVLALVENLQREELNPLEEARGYRTLSEEFGLTQEEIARSVGKDRSTVANMLRLLRLPPSIRKLLEKGALSMGHGRALLGLDDRVRAGELARKAVAGDWSVREVERRVRKATARDEQEQDRGDSDSGGGRSGKAPALRALQEELRKVLATRVEIRRSGSDGGQIRIDFHDDEDFERLFALIAGRETAEVLG